MASLFDDFPSSDSEDDVDYVPDKCDDVSDEEPLPASQSSDDEIETKKPRKRKTGSKNSTEDKIESAPVVNEIDEKKRAEDIYKSFLSEVEAERNAHLSEDDGMLSSVTCSDTVKKSGIAGAGSTAGSSSLNSELPKKSLSSSEDPEKKSEIFEFAGETVTVNKDAVICSSEETAKKSNLSSGDGISTSGTSSAQPVLKRKGGLESVLGLISKKKTKLSTLEKSKLDWNTFKQNEGIADELERFNKGKGGYLERKRFLERSDLRSYEVERDIRLKRKPKS